MAHEMAIMKKNELFKKLDEKVLKKFLDLGNVVDIPKDEVFVVEMSKDDRIALILAGTVKLEVMISTSNVPIEFGPGELAGLIQYFQDAEPVASFTATAMTDVRLLVWKAADWRKICEADFTVGYPVVYYIAKTLIHRVQQWQMNALNNVSWGIE